MIDRNLLGHKAAAAARPTQGQEKADCSPLLASHAIGFQAQLHKAEGENIHHGRAMPPKNALRSM